MNAIDADIPSANTDLVPARALSPGMVVWEVTPEEAAQLEALLKAKKGDPGTLARDLGQMQAGDPSLIR
jgi:hypothetical protein